MIYLSATDVVYEGCSTHTIKDRRASVSKVKDRYGFRTARSMTVINSYYEVGAVRRTNKIGDATLTEYEYNAPLLSFVRTGRGSFGKNGSVSNTHGSRIGLYL